MVTSPERMALEHGVLLRGITGRLFEEFGDLFTKETTYHYVTDVYGEMAGRAKVKTHLPAFVYRFAKARMAALAKNEGLISDHTPDILFVCERNDAVSQLAAALARDMVGDRATVHSAGTVPADWLLDEAVHVLHEVGIDMLEEFPKPVTAEIEQAADVVVTLDAHDDIFVVDDETQYHAWRTPDLHEDGLDGYRRLRDELTEQVRELVDGVLPR